MVKFLTSFFIGAFLLASNICANEIGIIDTSLIFQKAKFVQNFRESFIEREKEFNELREKKIEKLEKAQSKGKSTEEITQMAQEIEAELEPKKTELMQLEMSFQQNFLLNVTSTAKKIAEEYGLDVVLDKNVVYHGGFDISDIVLDKLNQ